MKEAYLYEKLDDRKVRCLLCNHNCLITPGETGICEVRKNEDGFLKSMVYDRIISMNRDPIEKKPFYHFYAGSQALSIATIGCNFKCLHCQNHEISQFSSQGRPELPGRRIAPEEIVEKAVKTGCKSISYTYTEPTIFFELAYDTAVLAAKNGIKNNFVTNGYMSEDALHQIAPYLHAANVDLKSFQDDFYRKVCGARLEPVLNTIRLMHDLNIWIEVTTLIIPDENDSPLEISQIANFIASVSKNIPWHVSAFYPHYFMDEKQPTPVETISEALEIGKRAGLHYIYSGNIWGDPGAHTYCPECGEKLIERQGYRITLDRMKNGTCPLCGATIAGFFQ